VTAPPREHSSAFGHHPFAARFCGLRPIEWPDIYFSLAGFIRNVSDPPSIRRKLAQALSEFRLQERKRLALAGQRQDPHIDARIQGHDAGGVQQKLAVRRPTGWALLSSDFHSNSSSPVPSARLAYRSKCPLRLEA